MRDHLVFIRDILECINKIEKYSQNISLADFQENELIQDGVVRNLEIIGEAVKKLPDNIKDSYSNIEWRKISGLRDILIHEYFGIDTEIIWDIITKKIPDLKITVQKIINDENAT